MVVRKSSKGKTAQRVSKPRVSAIKVKEPKPEPIESADDLTDKERLFVDCYLGAANLNGAKAARWAGYKDSSSIYVTAHELLRKPNIQAQIEKRLAQAAMSANEVLLRLSRQASADLGDLLDSDGSFDFSAASENGLTDQIREMVITERWLPNGNQPAVEKERTVKLKLHDPQVALAHLGKYHKLFVDRTELTGADGSDLLQPINDALLKAYGKGNAANKPAK